VCWGKFEAPTERKYNVAIVFKRARGAGRITRIDASTSYAPSRRPRHGAAPVPPGAPRRDWKKTLVSDGYLLLRHPDWDRTYQLAMEAATDITMWAE